MGQVRSVWLMLICLVTLAQVGSSIPSSRLPAGYQVPGSIIGEPEVASTGWLHAAQAVQAATRTHLRVIDHPACTDASFVSYRRSDLEPSIADQWYVASQLWADTALLDASVSDEADAERCLLAKGLLFLDRFRDAGGYYPRAATDGSDLTRGVYYADDNALLGLTLLAAADVEADPVARQQYLEAARSVATFLMTSGLWDETFGGGFWWNTNKGDRREGKPAQANALAALFFARLNAATGEAAYQTWALQTLAWLDAVLYEPNMRLYRWSVRYEDPRNRAGGPILHNRYFNYDQAITIEAQIMVARLDGNPDRISRARDVGRTMHATLWNTDHGGYNLEIGVDRIYASYGAWASFGHLALYDLDGDPDWLAMATSNANALDALFRRADGGYGYRQYRCLPPTESSRPGCEDGESNWVVDETRDGAAQAWMQHLQTEIARRYSQQPSTLSR